MKIYGYKGKGNIAGEQVRSLREKYGLSQEQLAVRLQLEGIQVNQKAISRIETGERVVADYELLTLAKVLGVSAAQLLGEEAKP